MAAVFIGVSHFYFIDALFQFVDQKDCGRREKKGQCLGRCDCL